MFGLGDLGLPEFLGLFVEVLQRLAAAAEGLQDADAVDGLLDRGGEVPGLVLAAAGHLAEAGAEAESVDHDRHGGGQENQGQLPAHREHHRDADHHGEGGDHQHDGAEGHPAAQEVQVRHGAGEQLPGAPAVMEGHREVLQVAVEQTRIRVSTVVAGLITNCRRSATSPASATPRPQDHERGGPDGLAAPPGCRDSLTRTRSTWGMARATTLASSAESRPMTSRGRIGLTCGIEAAD